MKASRISIHLISVALLFLWGGIMLYFYASGRIAKYLQSEGIFQPMVLVGGIGLIILGLFNLMTMKAEEAECCEHDHSHDHDHDHGCCGHDHAHEHAHHHAHEHHHEHGESCGHGQQGHEHHHEHAGHAHGILEESGLAGRLTAIFILAVPVAYAAVRTPDQFSIHTFTNKGGYTNVVDAAGAAQHSIKSKGAGTAATTAAKTAPSGPAPAAQTPPTGPTPAVAVQPAPADAPPAPPATAKADAAPAPSKADTPPGPATTAATTDTEAKSYGSFTLADLEAQVPKSKAGNFILEVPEIYYTAGDKEVQTVLNGQPVETVAQVLPEKVNNPKGTRLRIFRMLIQCCAADARPYSIPAEFGKKAPEFKDMTWVKVTGKMSYQEEGGQTVPILEAQTIEETTAPDNAMSY